MLDKAREAPNLASTLNQGAFNLGNAGGAWLGGLVIGAGLPLTDLPWLGAGVALPGLATVLLSALLDRRARGLRDMQQTQQANMLPIREPS